jgi:hypothetical protein
MSVIVYVACKMTGRDKSEMVARATRVCEIFREAGITPISPVVEEHVENREGKLINNDKERLHGYWKRDKEIIIKEAHVVFLDHAEMKSLGMEREYCLSRGVLWKPTIIYLPKGTPISVADWEDDKVFNSVHDAAKYIVEMWGTGHKRRMWRLKMLNRTLLTWIYRQILAWR